jgi:hypothetical protein
MALGGKHSNRRGQRHIPLQGVPPRGPAKDDDTASRRVYPPPLLHVLPDGFQRIRYYGFLGNRYREQKLAHCRELLGMPTPEPPALETAKDYRERYEELTGSSLWQCPVCHQGRMLVTQILPRRSPRRVSIKNSS